MTTAVELAPRAYDYPPRPWDEIYFVSSPCIKADAVNSASLAYYVKPCLLDGAESPEVLEPAYRIGDVLDELRGPEFADRLSKLTPGRESVQFREDISIMKLIRCLKHGGRAEQKAVEALLDDLFDELRKGEDFIHSELVMGILFALQRAGSAQFREVASVLVNSRAAELLRLSRYAKAIMSG
jgi:hypothetical protein